MQYYDRYLRKLRRGYSTNPRGMATHASFNETVIFTPGTCWRRPHDNPAIGFIEGLQLVGGIEDKQAIIAAAPTVNIDLFGPTSFYGPRTAGQFQRVVDELTADRDSRRAVVLIAHHDDVSSTIPCTMGMQFYYVPGYNQLCMTVTMRSSDAVWGMPYDMIQFGIVHLALSNILRAEPGDSVVNIGNAHVYSDHDGGVNWKLNKFTIPQYSSWDEYKTWAKYIVEFRPNRRELEKLFCLEECNE
jgi:hypothetical protein